MEDDVSPIGATFANLRDKHLQKLEDEINQWKTLAQQRQNELENKEKIVQQLLQEKDTLQKSLLESQQKASGSISESEKEGYRKLVEKSMAKVQETMKKLQDVQQQVSNKQREIILLTKKHQEELKEVVEKERTQHQQEIDSWKQKAEKATAVDFDQQMEEERAKHQEEITKWMQKAEKSAELLIAENASHTDETNALKDQIQEKDRFIDKLQTALKELRENAHIASENLLTPTKDSKNGKNGNPKDTTTKPALKVTPKAVKETKTAGGRPSLERNTSIKSVSSPAARPSEPEDVVEEDNMSEGSDRSDRSDGSNDSATSKKLVFKPAKGDEIDAMLAKSLVEFGLQTLPISRVATGTYEIGEGRGVSGKKHNIKIVNNTLMVRPPAGSYIKFDLWAKTMKATPKTNGK